VKMKDVLVGLGFSSKVDPWNFGRVGEKANRAGTHCKCLDGSRARKVGRRMAAHH
jgi:hypothetical protein